MAAAQRTGRASKRRASAVALALAGVLSGGAVAADVAIRFYDDNPLAQGTSLAPRAHAELEAAAGVPLIARGRDADGAFGFDFAMPLDASTAREALNRLRATGAVVYADLAAREDAAAKRSVPVAAQAVTALIVVMRPQAKRAGMLATPVRARIEQTIGSPIARQRALAGNAQLLDLDTALAPAAAHAAVAKLATDVDVLHVEVDRRAKPAMMPSDPMIVQQWNLIDAIGGVGAPAAWDLTTGDPQLPVAIIDTGLLPHPDLAGRVIGGYDFVADTRFANDGDGRDADPSDPGDWVTSGESGTAGGALQACAVSNSTWHGTMVAGTFGAIANNGSGVSGVNWSSPIVNVRVLGKCGGALSDVADGIRWAAGIAVAGAPANPHPARVLNLSIAGPGPCGPILQSAVTDALARGAVIVAAAGNGNDDVDNHWPANCNGVVAVAATSKNGSRAFYSSHGARVALAAPGGGIGGSIPVLRNTGTASPDPNGYTYGQQLGSSLAAPHISGAMSLALAVDGDMTAAELRALLERTARPFPTVATEQCTSSACGAGILDAASALRALVAQSPIDGAPQPAPAPAPASAPAPSPMPSPPPSASPSPSAIAAPPPMPVPMPQGWRAKSPAELERLRKTGAFDATPGAIAPRASRTF